MTYRAKRDNVIYTMSEDPYLIKDWEVVELVMEHKDKALVRYNGILMKDDRKRFHNDFDLIPERITYD